MLATQKVVVRSLTERDRQRLANLIHFEPLVHRHLDWRPPLDWLGYEPFIGIEKGHNLLAALACPPDPPQIAWIRLFAVSSHIAAKDAWLELWESARMRVEHGEIEKVTALPMENWFCHLLEASGFTLMDRVIMLSWEYPTEPAPMKSANFHLRSMQIDDIPDVLIIDQLAFEIEWQNSLEALKLAFLQSTSATIVEMDGKILGYQISTLGSMGGHIARLAVHTDYRGQGIGKMLLEDVLSQFARRGINLVTVNTQEVNANALGLYTRAGFRLTGEKFNVYQYPVNSQK